MYEYKSAYVREHVPRPRWKTIDAGGLTLLSLYRDYREAVLELTHPLYSHALALDLNDLLTRFDVKHSKQTVTQFLAGLGNRSLPTSQHLPNTEVTYATFVDAHQVGFEIQPVNTVFNFDVPLPKSDHYDLRLTHPDVDPKYMFDHCLITVNGLFHRTNYTGSSVNALEGVISGRYANQYQVGIYHLGKLGKIQTVPIRVRHVVKGGEEQPLGEKAYIEIDERVESLEGKSVLICIGGYLHLPDNKTIYRSGERTYTIDFKDYPLAQRYFEMAELLNLEGSIRQHFEKSSANETQVSVESLYSDASILELMQLSQSFFVIVDTPELFLDQELVEFNQLPGSYVTYEPPKYPLVTGAGRFYEYWTRFEHDRYVLNIDGGLKPNYLFETFGWKEENSIDASRVPSRVVDYTKASFWKLGKYRD